MVGYKYAEKMKTKGASKVPKRNITIVIINL